MARPYRDPVEIVTDQIPGPYSLFNRAEARIILGQVSAASHEPMPVVLLPGYEYRLCEWVLPEDGSTHWVLERRKRAAPASSPDDPDDD